MPAVEVESLVVRYGDVVAVDGVSFTAASGQVTALLGPNGAGKTSTVEVLEGFRVPAGGRVSVLGLDPHRDRPALSHRMGVMLQDGGVHRTARVHEAVELHCALHGRRRSPGELIELVGLGERRRATWKTLSGGEQRRLALALALAGRPEVAFLDEPTAGVDVSGRQVVRGVVRDLAAGGVAVVLTTHDLDEAERVADRIVIVDRGTVVAAGTPDELTATAGSGEFRFAAEPGLETGWLAEAVGAPVVETGAGEYVVRAEGTPDAVAALTGALARRGIALRDLRAGRRRLEDVFLQLTSEPSTAVPQPPAGRGARRRRGRS